MTDQEMISRIKESYRRSLQSNIEHHEFMTKAASDEGAKQSGKRHALLAHAYKALIDGN